MLKLRLIVILIQDVDDQDSVGHQGRIVGIHGLESQVVAATVLSIQDLAEGDDTGGTVDGEAFYLRGINGVGELTIDAFKETEFQYSAWSPKCNYLFL